MTKQTDTSPGIKLNEIYFTKDIALISSVDISFQSITFSVASSQQMENVHKTSQIHSTNYLISTEPTTATVRSSQKQQTANSVNFVSESSTSFETYTDVTFSFTTTEELSTTLCFDTSSQSMDYLTEISQMHSTTATVTAS